MKIPFNLITIALSVNGGLKLRTKEKLWDESYYCFENGDGTRYTVHLMQHEHGGILVMCNDSSMWLYFSRKYMNGDAEIKHLCGSDNEYTKRAIMQIMGTHCARFFV